MTPCDTTGPLITVDVILGPDEWQEGLHRDARASLASTPKTLSPSWLYDDRGSSLYDEITRLPEYYPARTEMTILDRHAGAMAAQASADTLVELGSGTSDKTRLLLDAMAAHGGLRRYVPFDISEQTLRDASAAIADTYGVRVHGVVGDFTRHLDAIPTGGTRLFAFLGGTIGNLDPVERSAFLSDLAAVMVPGDTVLIGTDMVKDRGRLVRAYDDAAGVTAAFDKNVLTVLNNDLDATFDLDDFDHVALFDEDHSWIEMRLRSRRDHIVEVPALGITLHFDQGEEMRTEISTKFRPGQLRDELDAVGMRTTGSWADPADDFHLTMAVLR